MAICTSVDDFIRNKDKAYWIATLSDGTVVYEDDGRPGQERVAWFRLREHCKEHKLSVTNLSIRFRSNQVSCCNSTDGIFFRRSCLGSMGLLASDGRTPKSIEFYIIGEVVGQEIKIKKWHVPELIVESEETRTIEGNEEGIIWNYALQSPDEQRTLHTT